MAAPLQDCILMFGDSLTQGGLDPYGISQRLGVAYMRKLDVINRGFSGYNTDWAIPVLKHTIMRRGHHMQSPTVRLMTIWLGCNDACPLPSIQHVPMDRFKENMKTLVSMVRDQSSPYYSPDTKIILITPPPLSAEQWTATRAALDPPKGLDRYTEVTGTYAEAVKDVGKEIGVPVTDIFTPMWEAAGKSEKTLENYLSDGLHLNGAGYEIVYDELMKTISTEFPELHPDKLQMVYPAWDEVDPNDLSVFDHPLKLPRK